MALLTYNEKISELSRKGLIGPVSSAKSKHLYRDTYSFVTTSDGTLNKILISRDTKTGKWYRSLDRPPTKLVERARWHLYPNNISEVEAKHMGNDYTLIPYFNGSVGRVQSFLKRNQDKNIKVYEEPFVREFCVQSKRLSKKHGIPIWYKFFRVDNKAEMEKQGLVPQITNQKARGVISLWNKSVDLCRNNGHTGVCKKGTAFYKQAKGMFSKLKETADLADKGIKLVQQSSGEITALAEKSIKIAKEGTALVNKIRKGKGRR